VNLGLLRKARRRQVNSPLYAGRLFIKTCPKLWDKK
jgi:hypothetical protein